VCSKNTISSNLASCNYADLCRKHNIWLWMQPAAFKCQINFLCYILSSTPSTRFQNLIMTSRYWFYIGPVLWQFMRPILSYTVVMNFSSTILCWCMGLAVNPWLICSESMTWRKLLIASYSLYYKNCMIIQHIKHPQLKKSYSK